MLDAIKIEERRLKAAYTLIGKFERELSKLKGKHERIAQIASEKARYRERHGSRQ